MQKVVYNCTVHGTQVIMSNKLHGITVFTKWPPLILWQVLHQLARAQLPTE
jgi:hypothetical protein